MAFAPVARFLAFLAFVALASLGVLVETVAGDCYTPDGQTFWYHQVCTSPTVGDMSSCCRTLDLCLDNLLCSHVDEHGNQTYYRGTCANSIDWKEPAQCPNFCKGHTVQDSHVGDWPVGKCPAEGTSATRWFCIGSESGYGTVDNCSDPSFGFTLDGDTQAFWTASIQPSYTPTPTTAAPGTSTRFSWKGTSTSSLPVSSSFSDDEQPSTSIQNAPSYSSEEMATTSSLGNSPSFTSAVDTPLSTSAVQTTTSPSVDQSMAITSPESNSIMTTPSDNTQTSVSDTPIISFSPTLTIEPPLFSQPQSTVTVHATPGNNRPLSDDGGASSNTIPIAVGVSIGTIVLIALACFIYLCIWNRRRNTPARAETPPPYEQEMVPLAPLPQAHVNNRRQSFGSQSK